MKTFSFTERTYFRSGTHSIDVDSVEKLKVHTQPQIDQLCSFCSHQLLQDVQFEAERRCWTRSTRGCCVLVDISGFSRLAQVAFDTGLSGLDSFRHNVSNVFNALIRILHEYGGDVIAFAGDALICYFDPIAFVPPPHPVPLECILRAVTCAICMAGVDMASIRVHTAVAMGDVSFHALGGYERKWSYLMTSACFDELSICIDEAGPHETVIAQQVSDVCTTSLQVYFHVEKLPSGHAHVMLRHNSPVAPVSPIRRAKLLQSTSIGKFLPAPVIAAVDIDSLDALAEVRIVTTLFLRLDSYSNINDVSGLQDFYFAMQEIIFEHGGFVRQFVIDDKGCVLIVLWGVPGASFPNNCCRAVRCGAQMIVKSTLLSHVCSIGVATGTSYCGVIGSDSRKDYVAMGKAVNYAARLMTAANGRLLLEQCTYECLPTEEISRISHARVGSMKGFNNMNTVYCYDHTTASTTPLVYADVPRDENIYATRDVLGALENVLSIARQLLVSQSDASDALPTHFVFMKGAPGSGKSMLLQKFCRDAMKYDVKTISIRLSRSNRDETYAPFRKLIRELLSINGAPCTDVDNMLTMELLRECYSSESEQLIVSCRLPVLTRIVSHSPVATSTTLSVSPRSVVPLNPLSSMDDSLVLFLSYMLSKHGVTAIVVDGAEYVSESSWRMFSRMGSYGIPVVILLSLSIKEKVFTEANFVEEVSGLSWNTDRVSNVVAAHGSKTYHTGKSDASITPTLAANLHHLVDSANTMSISLHALNFEDVSDYIQQEFTFAPVPLRVIEHVFDLSRGTAFWVFLLIRFIRDCGVSEFEKLLEMHMAEKVLATCLLANYTMHQCSIIKTASVFGDEFDTFTLQRVLRATNKIELTRTLTLFVNGGLIHRCANSRFKFHNVLIKNALYDLIPKSAVQTIHYKIALTIGSGGAVNDPSNAAMLAYHFSCSGSEHQHLAFRCAIAATRHCFSHSNTALGVCYIALGLRSARHKSDMRSLLEVLGVAEAILSNEEEQNNHSTHEHVLQLKSRVIRALAVEHQGKQRKFWGCLPWF